MVPKRLLQLQLAIQATSYCALLCHAVMRNVLVLSCRPCWCSEPHCNSPSGPPQDAAAGAGGPQDVDTRRHAHHVIRR